MWRNSYAVFSIKSVPFGAFSRGTSRTEHCSSCCTTQRRFAKITPGQFRKICFGQVQLDLLKRKCTKYLSYIIIINTIFHIKIHAFQTATRIYIHRRNVNFAYIVFCDVSDNAGKIHIFWGPVCCGASPVCCGTSSRPNMLWDIMQAQYVVGHHASPVCCGTSSRPNMLWNIMQA